MTLNIHDQMSNTQNLKVQPVEFVLKQKADSSH